MISLPDVLRKGKIHQEFDGNKIFMSLQKETSLSENDAFQTAQETIRCIISMNLHLLTAPLIREITCIILLRLGFERERLEYTRIGMPYYDIKKVYLSKTKIMNAYERMNNIYVHIKEEYKAVKYLIDEVVESD